MGKLYYGGRDQKQTTKKDNLEGTKTMQEKISQINFMKKINFMINIL